MTDEICILAVDDFKSNLKLIEQILGEACDHEILKARNGGEALDILERKPGIDILLLDLEMPVMDGLETLRRIKLDDRFRNIPVIIVTTDKSKIYKSLSMGANDFVAKPCDPEELKLRVLNHVRSKKLSDLASNVNSILEGEVIRKTADLQKALALSREAEFEISIRLGLFLGDLERFAQIKDQYRDNREQEILAGKADQDYSPAFSAE